MVLFKRKARGFRFADELVGLIDDAIVVADQDHNIIRFNAAAERVFGYGAAEVLGQPLDMLLPERYRLQHGLMMDDFARGPGGSRAMDHRGRQIHGLRRNGDEFLASVQIMLLGRGRRRAFAALVRDVGRDTRTEEEVLRLAAVDALTGAYNRREFTTMAEREALRAGRYQHPLSLLLLDLDDFSALNERYGTAAGDALLQAFADMCAHALRSVDIMGRWSAKEFIILLPETDSSGAMVIAERLRRRMTGLTVAAGEATVHATVSIGVAQFRQNDVAVDGPLARAAAALQDAKRGGRNRVAGGKG
jgi:diguanylate cyclase (GGDEF)-like protein/PAS domain S-box-containing protein